MSPLDWRQATIHFLSSDWKPRHGPHVYFCWTYGCTIHHIGNRITANFDSFWWENHYHFGYINLN